MLRDILTSIIHEPAKEDLFQAGIRSENQSLLQEVDAYRVTLQDVQPSDQQSCIISESEMIERALSFCSQVYQKFEEEEMQNMRFVNLAQEAAIIDHLAHQRKMAEYIELWKAEPSDEVVSRIKEESARTEDEILEWQNRQSRNRFEAEEEQVYQDYQNVLTLLQKFKQTLNAMFQEKVSSAFAISERECLIQKRFYHLLWQEGQEFQSAFLGQLKQFFSNFITYDISHRQFTLQIYEVKEDEEVIRIEQRAKILFQNQQIIGHFETMMENFREFQQFGSRVESITPKHQSQSIHKTNKQILLNLRNYFEHLIPFLSMEKRKKLSEFLSIGHDVNKYSMYDIFVSLKAEGQDADTMVESITQLIEMIEGRPKEMKKLLGILELAKGSAKDYSKVLFICDQLIQGIEATSEIDAGKTKLIRELLGIREEMRINIHQGQE